MPRSNSDMIHRLQVGLNSKGYQILINRSQFYSNQQQRPVTKYVCSQSRPNLKTGKNNHVTLFECYSTIAMVLFLRNLWFKVNDKPIPENKNPNEAYEKFQRNWYEAWSKIKDDEGFWDVPKLSNEMREAMKKK